MDINETNLEGLYEIEAKAINDKRGKFVKTFHAASFSAAGLAPIFKESFYSVSSKGVLRGMHFQMPPYEHAKHVYVVEGEVVDVVVDIRNGSKTYGSFYSTTLSGENAKSLFIEPGFAHGFLTTSESAIVVYSTTVEYCPEADQGIHWNSFGFDWEVDEPYISERDRRFMPLSEFRGMTGNG